MKHLIYLLIMAFSFFSCKQFHSTKDTFVPEIKDGKITAETLFSFKRIGNLALSSNKEKIIFEQYSFDISKNRAYCDLIFMDINGENKKRINKNHRNAFQAVFYAKDKKILFLSDKSGSKQIWSMNLNGGKA